MTVGFDDSAIRPAIARPSEQALLAGVYLRLFGGLALSAGVAGLIDISPRLQGWLFTGAAGSLGFTSVGVMVLIAPLFVLLLASIVIKRPTALGAGIVYWTVAGLVGASVSVLGLVYTGNSLVSALAAVGGAFAGLSIWGSCARRDITAMGVFFANGLFGLILVSLAAAFFPTSGLITMIDVAGLAIFSGLIAADTQRLKRIYRNAADPSALRAATAYGALTFYMSLVNLLQLVLALFAGRGRR